MRTTWLYILLPLFLASGCSRGVKQRDTLERNNPYVQKALEKESAGDTDAAVAYLEKALAKYSRIAYAHLKLAGLLESDSQRDYVGAIYHYREYLKLRPDTEKAEFIQTRIRAAGMALSAALAGQPPGLEDEVADLKRQNALLQAEIAELERKLTSSRRAPAGAESVEPPPPTVRRQERGRPPSIPRTYIVQRGDTLWSIANNVYRDPSKANEIFEANKSVLNNPRDIRPGQKLQLPR